MIETPVALERFKRLKQALPAVYFHIEEAFRQGDYDEQDEARITLLLRLGTEQMDAPCAWYEYDLLKAPYEITHLQSTIELWDQIPPMERPTTSRDTLIDRLDDLKREIVVKEKCVANANETGDSWSIVPLLEFFDLTEEERSGKSCYPLLPFFIQQAFTEMQTAQQRKPGLWTRWIQSIKRLRLSVSETGGEVEIEIHEHGETKKGS